MVQESAKPLGHHARSPMRWRHRHTLLVVLLVVLRVLSANSAPPTVGLQLLRVAGTVAAVYVAVWVVGDVWQRTARRYRQRGRTETERGDA